MEKQIIVNENSGQLFLSVVSYNLGGSHGAILLYPQNHIGYQLELKLLKYRHLRETEKTLTVKGKQLLYERGKQSKACLVHSLGLRDVYSRQLANQL